MPATKKSATSTAATVTRYIGKCPICEGEFKLTADKKMVHHGYTRPGHGSIEGDCLAVGHDPYEISCEITKVYRAAVEESKAKSMAFLARLQSGAVKSLTSRTWNGKGMDQQVVNEGETGFTYLMRTTISGVESEIRTLDREIARLTGLIDAWTLQPLRTVEEFEGPKAAEKAAKAAKRVADKAAKLADKIASYQKRIDSAVAKRKPWIIVDIFESAQRSLCCDFGFNRADAIPALERNHVFTALGFDLAARYSDAPNANLRYTWYEFSDNRPAWPAGL